MDNKNTKNKSDENFEESEKEKKEESEKEKKEEKKKQNIRLAERKGQRPAFPFKRKIL
jgi:hypothetical protein